MRVWDLVLNAEIACLRGTIGRVTSFAFSPDMKTLVVGAKDSKIAFYNILENYKQIGDFHTSEIEGLEKETEVNALLYYAGVDQQSPHLIIGGEQGNLAVIDLKQRICTWVEADFVPSEISSLTYINGGKQVVCVNLDQNVFTYDLVTKSKK